MTGLPARNSRPWYISMSERSFVNPAHLETLLELDRRHDELLAELGALDRRVCDVLREVRASIQPEAEHVANA